MGNFYPTNNVNISRAIMGLFMFAYSWLEFFSMFSVLFIELENLTKLSETFLFCMTQAAFLCKLTNFIFRKSLMKEIENLLNGSTLKRLTLFEKKIIDDYMVQFKYLSKIYRILCFLCVIFYGMFPFIDGDPEHLLALPGWFPFINIKEHQVEIVLAQICGVGIGAFNNSTLDLLAAILVTLGSAQFSILENRLKNVTKNSNNVMEKVNCCINYQNTLLE